MKKKAAKFMPHLLSDEQKRSRMKMCAANLSLLADIPELLDLIMTGDESSVPLFDQETKSDSMHWLTQGEPRPQKALHARTQTATMVTTFLTVKAWFCRSF